jgi:hypothetical protein
MGFGTEASVLMSDGSSVRIDNVRVGDYVMNKHMKPVRVNANYKQLSQNCTSFKRGGSDTTIYCTPTQKFAGYYETSGHLVSGYFTSEQMNTRGGIFKNTSIIFGTQNNVLFSNYSDSVVTMDVWSLDVGGITKSFIMNTIIATEDTSV